MFVTARALLLASWMVPLAASATPCLLDPTELAAPEALTVLLQRETACARDPAFLYQLGRLLNLAGQYAQAAERLEAALLRTPDDTHVQLEYAVALAGSGDAVAAQQLLDQVRRKANIDSATRRELDALLDVHAARTLLPRGSLHVSLGYDDNLLGAVRQGPFELTLPYGNIVVTPVTNAQAPGGQFARTDLRLTGDLPTNPMNPLTYTLSGSLWRTPGQPADRQHWGGSLENYNMLWPGHFVQLAWQQSAFNTQAIYQQTQLATGHSGVWALGGWACQQRLGLDLQRRAYPQADVLDGHYAGLQAQLACPAPALRLDVQLGQDQARSNQRPGGAQRQFSLRMTHQTSLGAGALQAQAEWSWLHDTTGYSQLLDNYRTRAIRRSIYRLEYHGAALPGLPGWQPVASFDWLQQQANLPLFSMRNRVVGLGLLRVW